MQSEVPSINPSWNFASRTATMFPPKHLPSRIVGEGRGNGKQDGDARYHPCRRRGGPRPRVPGGPALHRTGGRDLSGVGHRVHAGHYGIIHLRADRFSAFLADGDPVGPDDCAIAESANADFDAAVHKRQLRVAQFEMFDRSYSGHGCLLFCPGGSIPPSMAAGISVVVLRCREACHARAHRLTGSGCMPFTTSSMTLELRGHFGGSGTVGWEPETYPKK